MHSVFVEQQLSDEFPPLWYRLLKLCWETFRARRYLIRNTDSSDRVFALSLAGDDSEIGQNKPKQL